MPLKLLRVVPTPGLSKKYAAVFLLPNGRQRTVRFGTASNYVGNPRKTARDRAAYIARHRVNENHNDPLAGAWPATRRRSGGASGCSESQPSLSQERGRW